MLYRQGNAATSTLIDEVTKIFGDQTLVLPFQSTETSARRKGGWRMIASHTVNVLQDPIPIMLSNSELDDYVGTYQLDPRVSVKITRSGSDLSASTNGSPLAPLKVEIKDVCSAPGTPNTRRIFRRDSAEAVTGYINRSDGHDLVLARLP